MKTIPRRALVTGGGSGIGAAIARQLAAEGVRVLIAGRDAAKLAAVAAERPGIVEPLVGDLTIDEDRQRIADHARSFDGMGIDILVNNAGINDTAFLEDMDAPRTASLIQSNLLAPICLVQALLPHLKSLPRAQIVNIGSVFGHIGYPSQTVYSASKFGLRGFSEALCRELADTAVDVHYIAPRATRTAMNSPTADELNHRLGNHVDTPERVAKAVTNALAGRRTKAVIGWPEAVFVAINSIFPSVVDGALIKQLPVIRQYIQRGTSP